MGRLAARAFAGLAFMAAALVAMIFGSAGTFGFWQGWAYLLVFVGASILITLDLWRRDRALLERRLSAGPMAEVETSQKLIQAVMAVVFIGLMVVPGLDRRFGWSHVPAPLVVVGDLMTAASFYMIALVYRANSYAAATVRLSEGQQVIATGPYGLVRHPMYAAALPLITGAPLGLGSWWGFVWLPPFVAGLVWRLLEEEAFLVRELPGYAAYRDNVRYRLAPGLW